MNEKKSTTYNLYSTERRFKDETLLSYYFKPNKEIIKKSSPIDIDGERFKLLCETGEITEYTKKEVLNIYGASLRRTTILMNMLLNMNDFDWFCTLTFDRHKIDRTNANQVFNAYEKYINNIKKQFPNFKYMCFPEKHEDNCFHFHLLIGGLTPKQLGLVNSGKVCCSWATKKNKIASKEFFEKTKHLHELKETDGQIIYNITSFTYGLTTASKIVSRERCNSYVKKYVEKALGSTEVFKKRFYYSSNLNVPQIIKKLIGADFDTISNVDDLTTIKKDLNVQFCKSKYISEHNVLQVKIDNQIKDCLDNGLIPLSNEENIKLGEKF